MVPVPEIQFDGFSYPAFDQMVSHLAKYRMRTHGDVDMAVTVRIPSFGGIGAVEHHSESTETYWAHTAGLKVVVPSDPVGCLLVAAACDRQSGSGDLPGTQTALLEPWRRRYRRGRTCPSGSAAVRRAGDDVTVITYGGLVATALSAAELAADQHGWSLEVIDLRSLNPLDFDTVAESVRKTGRCVVMHEGSRTLGFGAELAARISEELFYDLESPVLRATGFDTPYPPARLEKLWLPGVDRLLDCVRARHWKCHERLPGSRPRRRSRGRDSFEVECRGRRRRSNSTRRCARWRRQRPRSRFPVPYAGRIVELGGAVGDVLPVGALLVRIDTGAADEHDSDEADAAAHSAPTSALASQWRSARTVMGSRTVGPAAQPGPCRLWRRRRCRHHSPRHPPQGQTRGAQARRRTVGRSCRRSNRDPTG